MCSEREEGINYEDHCSNLYGGGAGRHQVIRISGDEARVVGDRVFKSVSGAKLCDMAGYMPLRTRVCAGRRAPR